MGGRSLFIASCCALAALIAGCGGGEDSAQTRTASPATAAPPRTEPAQTEPARTEPDRSDPNIDINTGRRLAPNPWRMPKKVEPHPHAQVERVIVHDVRQGRGRGRVRAGDYVFMDFIEATYKTGWIFNTAWKHQLPFSTAGKILTPHGDVRGLLIGMRGMRPGGRRQIIVPARISGGNDADHPDYRRTTYWDVVMRGFYARGCEPDGEPCRSGP
jgi:hypothetical protein